MEPGEGRIYTDEDIDAGLAPALVSLGYDAVNARSEGLLGAEDEDVFQHCIAVDRILMTYNVKDFGPIHEAWVRRGWEHPGMIFSEHYGARGLGALIRDTSSRLQDADRAALRSQYIWL